MIGNFSFGFFIFFLYKFLVYAMIQLKFASGGISGINMIIMASIGGLFLVFMLLLVVKYDIFSSFSEKMLWFYKNEMLKLAQQ